MQALDHLSREELVALVRQLEQQGAATAAPVPAAAQVDLDYVSRQALTVLDNSGIPALIFDTEGELSILAANACLAALAGYPQQELESSYAADLLSAQDQNRLQRVLQLPRQGGVASTGSWRLRTRSGEVREIEVSGYDLDFCARRARFAIIQDVTQRRREELTQQRLAAIVESSRDAIFSRTIEGTVLSWNRAAERLFGYSAADIVGRNTDLLMPIEIREREADFLRTRIIAGLPIENHHTVRCSKDGSRIAVAVNVAPLKDTQGRIVGASSTIRDARAETPGESQREAARERQVREPIPVGDNLTELRRAQRAQREAEERLRSLVEASAHAVWMTDAAGEVVQEIPSWQRYTGLAFDQVRGRGWLDAVHFDDRERTLAAWEQARWSGTLLDIECRVRRHDGVWRHVHMRAVPVRHDDGSIREWIGMTTDVTERKEADATRALLAAVAESSQDAIISYDLEGTILSWNRGARELFGYQAQEVIGHDYRMLTPETTEDQARDLGRRVGQGERIAPFEAIARHRDGHEFLISVSVAVLRDETGRTVGVTVVARDVTEQRRAAHALRESERQLELILDNAAEAVIVLAADGSIERFNLEAQRLFGYSGSEVQALGLRQLILELSYGSEPTTGDEPHAAWLRPLLGGRHEVTGRRRDGSIFPLEVSLSEIERGTRAPRFTAVVRDITDRKSWENRIYTLAYTDSLTGLPNRLLLRDRLEHAIAAAQRNRSLVGVMFFDLDYFKSINDSYGHHVGDELLREIAVRTRHCVRDVDTVSRLGGDEFVLVLPDLREAADAGAVARKILHALGQPYSIDGREFSVTPTLGISIYPQDGLDADTLMRNADTAMYHAKESGKNHYRFFAPGGLHGRN